MNSTVVKSIDIDGSENHITAVFITAFIVYMSVVALVFVCCFCKPCLRGIFLCIYDRTTISSKKKGGSTGDKKWIQKAINPAHKGYCTPMTKPTCTPKRKALAITLKKMAKNR